jgi:phage gp36-like protein
MSYVTNSDIETRLGSERYVQLTDDAGSGAADLAVVAEARDGAEREADSYLARRYAVPIDLSANAEPAALLTTVVLDLIEYRLHTRRPPVPADVVAKRTATIKWLEQIAAGTVELPSVTPLNANPAKGWGAATTGDARVLSRKELAGY